MKELSVIGLKSNGNRYLDRALLVDTFATAGIGSSNNELRPRRRLPMPPAQRGATAHRTSSDAWLRVRYHRLVPSASVLAADGRGAGKAP